MNGKQCIKTIVSSVTSKLTKINFLNLIKKDAQRPRFRKDIILQVVYFKLRFRLSYRAIVSH
jgi:hypothetical protein